MLENRGAYSNNVGINLIGMIVKCIDSSERDFLK